MKYVECQFLLALSRAEHWRMLATTGAYKQRKTQRGAGRNEDGTLGWRDLTDEEKLADTIATAQRHIEFAQECAEHIGEAESDQRKAG